MEWYGMAWHGIGWYSIVQGDSGSGALLVCAILLGSPGLTGPACADALYFHFGSSAPVVHWITQCTMHKSQKTSV